MVPILYLNLKRRVKIEQITTTYCGRQISKILKALKMILRTTKAIRNEILIQLYAELVRKHWKELDSSIDGAIVDLKLGNQGGAGNQFIKEIERSFFRIPIFIFTANPRHIDDSLEGVEIHIKGDIGYYELLDRFWNIYETGLTHIMGSRGKWKKLLSDVFKRNIFPQIDKWIEHRETRWAG